MPASNTNPEFVIACPNCFEKFKIHMRDPEKVSVCPFCEGEL